MKRFTAGLAKTRSLRNKMGIFDQLCCPKCGLMSASPTVFQCSECRCVLEVQVNIGHLVRADFERMRHSPDRSRIAATAWAFRWRAS